jgi:hypothetical protein
MRKRWSPIRSENENPKLKKEKKKKKSINMPQLTEIVREKVYQQHILAQ